MLLNPFIGTSAVGSSGITYFFEERFEGTGYDNSNANGWTEAGAGTIDEDYTGVILEGTQSLRIVGTAQQPTITAVFDTDQDELWGYCRFRLVTAFSATRSFMLIRNSSGTTVGGINLVVTTNVLRPINGTPSGGTTDGLATATDYNIWWHWAKGTGADGDAGVGFSTTGTEPVAGTTYDDITAGSSTTDAHDIVIGLPSTNTTGEFVIDQILISTTGTIGNSPA